MDRKSGARYSKQIKLEGFGKEAQNKLTQAKVLVIGAGGLGCPAITYLAASGIGTISIMDHDLVEETNLHRQPIYVTGDIGKPKVIVSAERVQQLNPDAAVLTWQEKISPTNALSIIKDFDVVLDCTDNYEARYLINDACVILNKPWIYGAVEAWEGQLAVFNAPAGNESKTPTYRCIFPEASLDALSCNDVGVIGTMPGTVGLLQANEAIKLITGVGEVQNGLLLIDLLRNNFQKIQIKRNEEAVSRVTHLKNDYSGLLEINDEIDGDEILLNRDKFIIIDIREGAELVDAPFNMADLHIPMQDLLADGFSFDPHKNYILVCASGRRSTSAVRELKTRNPDIQVLSLKGGVAANGKIVTNL